MSDDTEPTDDTWDAGTTDQTVTITAPVRTVNWSLLALVALGCWWVYSSVTPAHRGVPWEEDDDED
jgi:hypothetical protein